MRSIVQSLEKIVVLPAGGHEIKACLVQMQGAVAVANPVPHHEYVVIPSLPTLMRILKTT